MLLQDEQRQGRLDDELKRLERYPLLVCDEVGCIPFDPQAANVVFMLVSRPTSARADRHLEQAVLRLGEIFGDDATAAGAMIDRLVHHAGLVSLKGDSYRLKDHVMESAFADASCRLTARP